LVLLCEVGLARPRPRHDAIRLLGPPRRATHGQVSDQNAWPDVCVTSTGWIHEHVPGVNLTYAHDPREHLPVLAGAGIVLVTVNVTADTGAMPSHRFSTPLRCPPC